MKEVRGVIKAHGPFVRCILPLAGLLLTPMLTPSREAPTGSLEAKFSPPPVSISQGEVTCSADHFCCPQRGQLAFRYQIDMTRGHNHVFPVASQLEIRFLDQK